MIFGGSKTPSKAPPRGPEWTPRARKRSPRAKHIKNESKRQARLVKLRSQLCRRTFCFVLGPGPLGGPGEGPDGHLPSEIEGLEPWMSPNPINL